MKLAIFGGTFDPIHQGHLAVARAAAATFSLHRILLVPAASPPHKAGVTHAPYDDRVRMAEIAAAADPVIEVSRIEEGTARSYSIETIEKLRARLDPDDELFFIIGADAFAEIRTWYRWQDVAGAVRFLVVSRPGWDYDAPPSVRFDRLDSLAVPISSSAIREALAAGKFPVEIPAAVLAYIQQHGLYGTKVPV